MTIVCGTDFSNPARDAVAIAETLACRSRQDLLLIHSVVELPCGPVPTDVEPVRAALSNMLESEAAAIRKSGIAVTARTVVGWPEEQIVEAARESNATMIVLGAVGHGRGLHWLIGSVAERVALTTPVPLLLVRDRKPLDSWLAGNESLQVILATDFSPVSDFALEWLPTLTKFGSCDVTLAYAANPVAEYVRLDLPGPIHRRKLHPVVADVLQREMHKRETRLLLGGAIRTRVSLTLDAPGVEIARLAGEGKSGMVVVGANQRSALERAWHRSTGRDVIHHSTTNVLSVPFHTPDEQFRALERPAVRTILAATDFSPCGNRAVAWAMGVAQAGATVVIFNAAEHPEARVKASAELAQIDRPASWPACVKIAVEVADDGDVAKSIWSAAQRAGADLIVVGAHGHAPLQFVLGSVAREVLALSTKPVLVVRGEAD